MWPWATNFETFGICIVCRLFRSTPRKTSLVLRFPKSFTKTPKCQSKVPFVVSSLPQQHCNFRGQSPLGWSRVAILPYFGAVKQLASEEDYVWNWWLPACSTFIAGQFGVWLSLFPFLNFNGLIQLCRHVLGWFHFQLSRPCLRKTVEVTVTEEAPAIVEGCQGLEVCEKTDPKSGGFILPIKSYSTLEYPSWSE